MSLLLSMPYVPFSLALGLLLALLLLETAALLIGGSLFGASDGPDLDVGLEGASSAFDLDPGEIPDVDALLSAADNTADVPEAAAPSGFAGLLGLGATPFMVWFAAALLGFGVTGFVLQSLVTTVFGAPLAAGLAGLVALPFGLGFARKFSGVFARFLPKYESSATSLQFMGGLRGKVTQGVARRGVPAEVRLHDRHNNVHYLRCEPFGDADEITEGSEVLTVRQRVTPVQWAIRIIAIG
ncbi:OB-fold-containig protein [Tabrizicola sp.]|uniref:OB-fold-containig protein n=1 Tax=Tabrizicola sp. TaxID=2005166 RepID=UPI003F3261F8